MPLTSGTRLGPYEILAPIGAGGMGEVYKAKDTRLDRTVAIKVLPEHLAESPERKARFEREAKAISQLNHPHICTLYDVGEQDGIDFIVMEYIEGETLADRLKKGALKLDEALEYGIQIADGLDKAHRAGIVHRDLKPANAMLTKSGVKLLDFGLVRLVEGDDTAEPADAPTRQKDLTKEESIIGTLQYMAPEQLEHKPVDARTDIFAFGVLLFEMVTGRRAFEGETQASLISAIMTSRVPALTSLEPASPKPLDHVLERCVEKEPDARWQAILDVRHELEWLASRSSTAGEKSPRPVTSVGAVASAAILAAGLAGGLVLASFFAGEPARDVNPKRLSMSLAELGALDSGAILFATIAADGTRVAFVHRVRGGRQSVYVRSLSAREARQIPVAEGAEDLFLSPDGEWLGFNANERLQKVPVAGGPPVVLSETGHIQGATWGEDGSIVFGYVGGGLARVSENGGAPEALTELQPGEVGHWWPQRIPDSDWILFTVWTGSYSGARIEAVSSTTGERKPLNESGIYPFYSPSGHLVLLRQATIVAAPFDPKRLEILGPARSVEEQVGEFAVSSSNGTLIYSPRTAYSSLAAFLVEVDRSGSVLRQLTEDPLEYPRTVRLGPNGRSLAIADGPDNDGDIWVYDLDGRPPTPLFFSGHNLRVVWSPDGDRVVFSSTSLGGALNLFSMTADGSSGEPQRLAESPGVQQAWDWTPDGKEIVFGELVGDLGWDLFSLPVDGNGEPVALVATESHERQARLSSDGRWLAYVSDVTGKNEVWVRPYRRSGSAVRVSPAGGDEPVWSYDDRELYYRQGSAIMAVAVETSDELEFEAPEQLFEGRFYHENEPSYDVTPDGTFIMMRQPEDTPIQNIEFQVVLDWGEELKRLVPVDD